MVVSLLAVQETLNAGAGSTALALVSAVFIIPVLLFSGYAGHAADVLSKRTVLVVTTYFEVLVLGLACGALLSGRLDYMLSVLFLLATQATFFGPAKYGLLSEILPARDLARANGLIEMSTFVAIILGTALGTAMFVVWYKQLEIIGLCLITVAVVGTGASLRVPSVPPSGARQVFRLNPWGEICRGLRRLGRESRLGLTVLGIAFFWLFAALMQMAILLFGKEVMGLDDLRVGLLGTFLALGIGAGSLTAGRLSDQKVELGLVPLGACGMGTSTLLLSISASSYTLTAIMLVGFGSPSGWFIVPLQAFLQYKSRVEGVDCSWQRPTSQLARFWWPLGLVGVRTCSNGRPIALFCSPALGSCSAPSTCCASYRPLSSAWSAGCWRILCIASAWWGRTYPGAGASIACLQSCLLCRRPPRRVLVCPASCVSLPIAQFMSAKPCAGCFA
jgi:predicted MFS family arabinose efflux permease